MRFCSAVRRIAIAARQIVQPGATLQAPLVTVGMGRTNNYLDDLGIAYPAPRPNDPLRCTRAGSVIPNSTLIIIAPDAHGSSSNKEWTIQMLLTPSEYTVWVIVTTVIAMIIIGIFAIAFKYREYVH